MAQEESLFGGLSLMDNGMIEIGGSEEPPKPAEKPATPATTIKEEDFMIDIPDTVTADGVVETDTTEEAPEEGVQDTKKKDTPPSKGSSSSSQFTPFAKALYEEGVLSSFDEEEFGKLVEEMGPAEALIELNKRTIQEEIEAYKREAEEDYKAFIEARDAGLDLDEWASIQENKKVFSSITDSKIDEDEELQKNLVRADLRRRNFSEEEINDTIESYEDTNKLGKQAKKALENLKKFESERETQLKAEKDAQEKEAAKRQKEQLDSLKKTIEGTTEIVPGMKINKQVKDKLFTMITTPVSQGPNGEPLNAAMAKRMADPIKYAMLEAYFVELGLFDGKFDSLVKRAKSTAVKELEKQLSPNSNTEFTSSKSAFGDRGVDDDSEFAAAFGRIKF